MADTPVDSVPLFPGWTNFHAPLTILWYQNGLGTTWISTLDRECRRRYRGVAHSDQSEISEDVADHESEVSAPKYDFKILYDRGRPR